MGLGKASLRDGAPHWVNKLSKLFRRGGVPNVAGKLVDVGRIHRSFLSLAS
jgi:hypothetical protein